jgi:hypothetical protein
MKACRRFPRAPARGSDRPLPIPVETGYSFSI